MPARNHLQNIALTQPRQLQTLVENRRIYNLNNCELNVFESYEKAYNVPLTFGDFVVTSMVRGKKIMHLNNKPAFDYLPGESVIVPANETMVIDFPEAENNNPSQCIALAVDAAYINKTVNYLSEYYNSDPDQKHGWQLQFNQYHFENNTTVTALLNNLVSVCSSGDSAKNILADLHLKELLVRLLQSQHLLQESTHAVNHNNESRLTYVLHYIHEHLTEKITVDSLCHRAYLSRNAFFKWFKEQFGITPVDYINYERIKMAKQLLGNNENVTEVSLRCGFSDVNYFVRLFKKTEGITPKLYQHCVRYSVS